MTCTPWGYYAHHLRNVADGNPRASHHSSLRSLYRDGLVNETQRSLTPLGERMLADAEAAVERGDATQAAQFPDTYGPEGS